MAKLRTYKTEDGSPAVKCPRCDELITPTANPIFDGYDCPECSQIIEEEDLSGYLKAKAKYDEENE